MQQEFSPRQPVPSSILRRAEARGLGDWLCSYRLPQKTGSCLFLLLPTLFIELLFVGSVHALGAFIALGITLWPLVLWAGWTFNTSRSRIDLFSNGFIHTSPLNQQIFPWKEIKMLWRGTYKNSSNTQSAGVKDIDTIKIRDKQGRAFEISTLHKLNEHERARICDTIESYFVATHLPALLEGYQRGEILNFDPLFVSRDGLWNKGDFLPWSQVETIEIGPEQIVIRREGRTSDWYRTWVPRQPNACLLNAVVEIVYKAAR
ncbi:DUF6585 family protein [Thermogemmatispora tikiterensis]|uniref:Uncharacterized protein n=1 Tax=Thermogemmatispora tikiterensis TaxID=1825093 RepID=A0A328VEX2_9CHLR|nr:DUF6585 family protein [Thermogemmatispora tikiterensis]RAQ96246.1 hypothetical protein A4R35_11940 [Thermogemmatispora tikiterensis]